MESFEINKILIPLDFSETSLGAIDYAVEISQIKKADIILLNVVEVINNFLEPGYFDVPAIPYDYQKEIIDQSKKT